MNILTSNEFGVPFALLTLTLWLAAALAVEARLPKWFLVTAAGLASVTLLVAMVARFAQVA